MLSFSSIRVKLTRAIVTSHDPNDPSATDLAGALHDVSNSLTVVLGWAEEASHPGASLETISAALRVIAAEARRGRSLARAAIGGESKPTPARIEAVVQAVAEGCAALARRRGIFVHTDIRAGGQLFDALELEHVLLNLALNAVAFARTQIVLRLFAHDRTFVIEVADDGEGVPEARRESIFRGDSTREGGTGIGLAHARSVLRARGGDLTLSALAQGGACFVVRYPHVPEVPRSKTNVSRGGLEGIRVLLVEDDLAVRALLETALEARGAVLSVAEDLRSLLSVKGAFDAVLIDLSPIASNADAATKHLQGVSHPDTWILATGSSGNIPKTLLDAALVEKPFEVSEIVAAITAAVDRGRAAKG